MARNYKMKIDVEITPIPELCAKMFVKMDSDQQAKTLSMIWDGMRADYGSEFKAAMQCAYIRGEEGFDAEARALLDNLARDPDAGVSPSDPMFKVGDEIDLRSFQEPDHNGRFVVGDLDLGPRDPDVMAAMEAHSAVLTARHEQAIIDELGIIEIDHRILPDPLGVLGGKPRITCKLRARQPGEEPYQLGGMVKYGNRTVGWVTQLNDDGTAEVVMHDGFAKGGVVGQGPSDPVSTQQLPPCDCGAEPNTYHLDQCARVRHDQAVQEFHGVPLDREKFRGAWTPATKSDVCDECKGTGFYTGFNTTEPCSKGCKAP